MNLKERNTSDNSEDGVDEIDSRETSGRVRNGFVLTPGLKDLLASRLVTLGHFHEGEYVIHKQCLSSLKDVAIFLRKENSSHEVRRFLGQSKMVQNDLIHIVKACPPENKTLFDLAIRLLITLTFPVILLFGEQIPKEKESLSIYMTLTEQYQEYKEAFHDVDFWNLISGRLTDLFEVDWTERSEDDCDHMERLLVLIRNVLQIPANAQRERITENDVSIHDKILWDLRQSQILEFLLYVSSNKVEHRYCLHLLEIFSLILRGQDPKLLALSEVERSRTEREKDMKDLLALREREKAYRKQYSNIRSFDSTIVLRGMKTFAGNDVIYHGSVSEAKESVLTGPKRRWKRRAKVVVASEPAERRSSFSVRIFLKEFCIEFLNCSYNILMKSVKELLISGRGLAHDECLYFWALKFFLEFNCAHNLDIKLISDSINVQTVHFLQRNMEENFEKLATEKTNKAIWVRKLHMILKSYHSLLQTLKWMDSSKDAGVREMSEVLKSQIFYIVEYRDIAIHFATRFNSKLFSHAYAKDLVEVTHLAVKLLEEYSKRNNIVVQRKIRKKTNSGRKKNKKAQQPESYEEIWSRIREDVRRTLTGTTEFPDISPFDLDADLKDDQVQKQQAMQRVQRMLHAGNIESAVGLLRSARKVWPENDHFGSDAMSVEEEVSALQDICLTDLGNKAQEAEQYEEDSEEESPDQAGYKISEQTFDIMDFKKQLIHKKVVEACGIVLKNYIKNSEYTNHCAIKLLFRIGWECSMPAMMYQASLFCTLYKIMNDKCKNYKEINDFTKHLFRKFRKDFAERDFVFVELIFWKDPTDALDIQGDDRGADEKEPKKGRAAGWSEEEEDELERLWLECDPKFPIKEKIQWIKDNLIDESKSLSSIKKKLKELGLLKDTKREARLNSGLEWTEEEVEELKKLFEASVSSSDIVDVIADGLTVKRTKKCIESKLLEIGLVQSKSQLRKKKRRNIGPEDCDSESESEDEDKPERPMVFSVKSVKKALKKVEDLKESMKWLRSSLEGSIREEGEDNEPEMLVPCMPETFAALETDDFINLLDCAGMLPPNRSDYFWRVPLRNAEAKRTIIKLLDLTIAGELVVSEGEEEPLKRNEKPKKRKLVKKQSDCRSDPRKNLQMNADDDDDDAFDRMRDEALKPETRRVVDSDSDDVEDVFDKLRALRAKTKAIEDSRKEDDVTPSGKTRKLVDSEDEDEGPRPKKSAEDLFDELKNSGIGKPKKRNVLDSDDDTSEDRELSKRRRFIDSDSEEEEAVVSIAKKSRRVKMLDSESDAEIGPEEDGDSS